MKSIDTLESFVSALFQKKKYIKERSSLTYSTQVITMNTDINLDTNVINSKKDTYSSVTDLNDVNLFTERIHTGKEIAQERANEQYITVGDMLFVCDIEGTNVYEETTAMMFEHKPQLVKKEYIPPKKISMLFIVSASCFIFVIVITALMAFFKKKRRKERTNADKYYAY